MICWSVDAEVHAVKSAVSDAVSADNARPVADVILKMNQDTACDDVRDSTSFVSSLSEGLRQADDDRAECGASFARRISDEKLESTWRVVADSDEEHRSVLADKGEELQHTGAEVDYTGQDPRPSVEVDYTGEDPRPSAEVDYIGQGPQLSGEVAYTCQAPRPSAEVDHTGQDPRPSVEMAYTSQDLRPNAEVDYTGQDPQPSPELAYKRHQKQPSVENAGEECRLSDESIIEYSRQEHTASGSAVDDADVTDDRHKPADDDYVIDDTHSVVTEPANTHNGRDALLPQPSSPHCMTSEHISYKDDFTAMSDSDGTHRSVHLFTMAVVRYISCIVGCVVQW